MDENAIEDTGTEEVNQALSMSDEEFLEADFSSFGSEEEEKVEEEEGESEESEEVEEESDPEETELDDDPENEADPEDDPEDETNESNGLEEIFKPFKANGKEMKVDNVEDARRLMQMGANYAKKMTALKPHLKIVKMLENQGLLDEGKLSYLIDIEKKNPQAIMKLIKDSGIDPLEIDVERPDEYTPKSYTVGDAEVELEEVMNELRDSSAYQTTMDILGTKWDDSSKSEVVKKPGLIRFINEHVETGIYQIVADEMDKRRVLGKLDGMSDLEAYVSVGNELHAAGAFKPKTTPTKSTARVIDTASKEALLTRKKSAGVTKAKPASKLPDDFNPLALSDEEFEKLDISKFR